MPNESQEAREEEQDRHAPEEAPSPAPDDGAGDGLADDRTGAPGDRAAADVTPPAGGEAASETAAAGGAEPPAEAVPPRRAAIHAGEPSAETSFGTWLRRQREMREIELREIADKTKISLRYLQAMEQDRFDVLPAAVFARGFLREYSRYVGLNPDEVVNYYLAAHQGADTAAEEEQVSMSAASRGPGSKRFLVLLVAILLLAVVVYAYFYQRSRASREEAAPPPIAAPATDGREAPPEPVPVPEPAAELPLGAPLVVTLDFTQNCWVEATVDGRSRTSKLFVAGESLQLEADQRVMLETLGNATGVEVQVNGRPYDLPPVSADGSIRGVVIEAPGVAAGTAGAGTAAPRRTRPRPPATEPVQQPATQSQPFEPPAPQPGAASPDPGPAELEDPGAEAAGDDG